MANEKVYIKLKEKAVVGIDTKIKIKDISEIYCGKPELMKNIEDINVSKADAEENWDYINSVQVAGKILDKYPNLDLDILGSSEVIIEYKTQQQSKPFLEFIKVVAVCIILFFGASIAMMNFHQDVDSREALQKLYYTFTGEKSDNPLIMAIPYCIGIGVGMLTFFSRIFSFSRRRKKEPGPMEVELFLYDDETEQYVLNELKNNRES
jgi:stage V sporulation protein AA